MAGKKNVLVFGDSLTWGAIPGGGGRHPHEDRWTSVLEAGLAGVRVIAEGLSGRTTSFDDYSSMADRNGVKILPTLLASHYPLDLVAIMLGANDLKPHVCGRAEGAAAGVGRLVEIIRTFPYGYKTPAPLVLIMSPPIFQETTTGDRSPAGGRSIAESCKLSGAYKAVADKAGCAFLDTAEFARASEADGVHLDSQNTRAIGIGAIPVIAELLGL